MPMEYTTTTISPRYHQAIVDWQWKNFSELDLLMAHWERFFHNAPPFQLVAKIGTLKSDVIEGGKFAGQPKIEKAAEMSGNMFYAARSIIRAQCSTELGSIQQHRLSLESAIDEEAQFDILRIMAEELRHAYQMFWVLDHDPTWKRPAHGDVAAETLEELLSMELGTHVLDAFNIPFHDFLDNSVYTMVIDLVGKYQLDMQTIFSYAPMARSMMPMLGEEGFHMGTGRRFTKQVALMASRGEGRYSLADIQRAINQWYPRGLEMFGNEQGGETAVIFGFKTKTNSQAQAEYIAEVGAIIEGINVGIVRQVLPELHSDECRKLVREITGERTRKRGIRPEQMLYLPDHKFFRRRGPEEVVFRAYDIDGRLLTRDSRPYMAAEYLDYLSSVLPTLYLAAEDFERYREKLQTYHQQPPAATGFSLN